MLKCCKAGMSRAANADILRDARCATRTVRRARIENPAGARRASSTATLRAAVNGVRCRTYTPPHVPPHHSPCRPCPGSAVPPWWARGRTGHRCRPEGRDRVARADRCRPLRGLVDDRGVDIQAGSHAGEVAGRREDRARSDRAAEVTRVEAGDTREEPSRWRRRATTSSSSTDPVSREVTPPPSPCRRCSTRMGRGASSATSCGNARRGQVVHRAGRPPALRARPSP